MLKPEELLVTTALFKRPARAPDLNAELDAHRELSALMTVDPVVAIQRFLDLSIELCPVAGSAGLSEISEDSDGAPIFRWSAMSGAFAPHVGGSTPRDFSPCGLCIDQHHTILLDRPSRVFTYLKDAEPEVVEGLIVPLYDTGKKAIGTLWVTSHDEDGKFDATDARIMEQLAVQLVLAIKLRRKAAVLVELEEAVRGKDVLVQEVRHRVKNMIQMTSGLLRLQERGVNSGEARTALRDAQSRLLVLASVYEKLLLPNADGDEVDVAALIGTLASALRDGSAHGSRVNVRADCDQLMLPVTRAVPVGLIVNEAVTNALKHAFAETGGNGEVAVTLRKSGRSCVLTISDDGSGFEKPSRTGSLGMRLIRNLARQLGAELAVDGSAGTTIRLEWSIAGDLEEEPRASESVSVAAG